MINVDEALARVLVLAPQPTGETVPLMRAARRVLLKDAVSRMTQPPFNASSMDGYAYRVADQGQRLKLIGEAAAGHPWTGTAAPGTAVRIFTGAPVPDGYDCVEMQENVDRDGDVITIHTPSQDAYIRSRGCDFGEGDRLSAGRLLTSADIGLLAAMNVPEVVVARRPKVAILAGGDELVRPGTDPSAGQIISSNEFAVAALLESAGAEVEILPIARDTEQSLTSSLTSASDADLVVTIGGASVGDHDLVGRVAVKLGFQQSFYKIAMRPGKPLMAGQLGRSVMIGVPGNPVSAMICTMVFALPLIAKMQGLKQENRSIIARLTVPLKEEGNRQHYLRARLDYAGHVVQITPFERQDSSLLSVMSQSNALLVRPAHDPAREAGDMVTALPIV